jgi:hypothetical protein
VWLRWRSYANESLDFDLLNVREQGFFIELAGKTGDFGQVLKTDREKIMKDQLHGHFPVFWLNRAF